MLSSRVGFAWLFLIATLVAQGPHRHDQPSPQFAEPFGSCDEAGRHWAGHEATGDDGGADACPLCHLRHQPMLAELAPITIEPVGRAGRVDVTTPRLKAGSILRSRCRAPPEG